MRLVVVASVASACTLLDEPSPPQADDSAARIKQAVAATLEAQNIEESIAATVAAAQQAPTLHAIRATATPTATPQAIPATATPSPAPTYTPKPTPTMSPTNTPTRRPTFTPRPTLKPTRRPTPTPQWRPPTVQELAELKQLMLELTNEERVRNGVPRVNLGNNPSPQIHAEQGLANCYSSHWDLWGLKPLYRYALTGGDQYTAENGSGINYCPKASENYRIKQPGSWEDEVRKTVAGWIRSPAHHQNLIDPRHTVLHAGIAIDKYHTNMVQAFSGEYVAWEQRPKIDGTILTAAGSLRDAYYDEDDDYVLVTIEYHPPPQQLTRGQLAGTYCLETDIRVGALLKPLQEGWYYTSSENGREFTDYDVETQDNSQCVNPYEPLVLV